LKDRSASPQSGLLNTAGTRGLNIKGKADSASSKFRKGDIDRLGAYILTPLWKYLQGKRELLVVPDGLLNRVSIAALQWNRKNLFEYMLIRQLSGSNVLSGKPVELLKKSKALLAGSLRYDSDLYAGSLKPLNKNIKWNYLPGTATELGLLLPVFRSSGISTDTVTGYEFPDSARRRLSGYNIIHLATHGFYFDSSTVNTLYSQSYNLTAIRENPMMRCGIAMSYANTPPGKNFESDGYLFGFELANTDLRNCYLVSLSACETGLGDLRNNLGVDGLSRALKLGGARHLLISLWKVPDQPTAVFMQHFYKELFSGSTPAAALRSTQKMMSADYPVADWAAFILVE
ncbi:MAG TPA: CHAT domain-containing protein, partial [Chitinophagaceae bacterium]